MGKATIISHKGNGLYNVRINKETAGYDKNIASATARLLALDTDELPAAVTEENDKEIAYGLSLIDLDSAIGTFNAVPTEPEAQKLAARKVLTTQQAATQNALLEWGEAKLALRRALNEKDAVEVYKASQTALRVVAVTGDVRDIWMADLTTTKVLNDVVGIFDIPNETFNNHKAAVGKAPVANTAIAVIRPAVFTPSNEDHSLTRDGIEQAASGDIPSGAQTFWNWAVKPAWVIGKPTARVAEVLSVDYVADTADIRVLNIDSWIRNFQTKPFGEEADTEYGIYRDVPVEYMTCNARAFAEKDRVIVEFEGQSETVGASTGPRVVGFETNPRECITDGFNYARFNVAGPYADVRDVGAGWVVDITGSPTTVNGNIDVQTHGNTRAAGGLVPDPIRFNGPYRRHIPQLMDPTLEVSPQPILWSIYWYADRTVAGSCIGNILGIGSQDDVSGDATFVIAAVDEATVPGSVEEPHAIGFYRRQYDGADGLYDITTNPNGWQKVGSYVFAEAIYEGHDLPVFFNRSGTKAVHVRYRKPITASGTFQARSTKGDNSASPVLKDLAKPRMFDTEMTEWTFALDYSTPPVAVVTPGGMESMTFVRTEETDGNDSSPLTFFSQKGSYIIGAEYLNDIMTICRYSIDHLEVNRVATSHYQASPWEHAGEKFYDLDINNRLEFEYQGIGGTAEVQVAPDTFSTLKDTSAGFIANEVRVGLVITNTTTDKTGTILEVVDDSRIRTSALLAGGELEITPPVSSQYWSASDTFTIDMTSDKTIPITQANWHTKQIFDTRGDNTLDGVGFSSFQANAEFVTKAWSVETNGDTRWFQAALAFLDVRYGTAILDIHRLDGGDPFDTTNFLITPEASDPVVYNAQTFYSPSHVTGLDHAYFGVYSKWGEVGKLEWPDSVIAETGQTKTNSFTLVSKYLLENTYSAFQSPIGLYNYWNNEPVPGYYSRASDGAFWPYEAGEVGELGSVSREFQQQPVGMYQGQYQLLSSSLRFERDRSWPTMPSTIGYYEWTDNTTALDKLFAYWYGGTPNQWRASVDDDWLMNSSSWGIFGPTSAVGMRSFTADLTGFTTEPLPVVPMIGNCATTNGNAVFFSGILFVDVIKADRSAEITIADRYAFLSGEGSNLLTLRTLLGGTPDQWFPLGVAQRNI